MLASSMMYQAYEWQRQMARPVRLWANTLEKVYSSPYNPLSETWFGKSVAASAEIMARLTQNYGKPAFGLETTRIGDQTVAVNEEILLRKPFCQLVHFHRDTARQDPKLLVVAPMSGHFATLLRGTVEAFLELVHAQPPLGQRIAQHIDDVLPLGVRSTHVGELFTHVVTLLRTVAAGAGYWTDARSHSARATAANPRTSTPVATRVRPRRLSPIAVPERMSAMP